MCDIREATMKNPKVRQVVLPLITALIDELENNGLYL